MGLNIDAAVSRLLGSTSGFVVDPERRANFVDGEYGIGRYINRTSDYFLVTNKAIRIFDDNRESIIWYDDMRSIDFEGAFDTSSPPQMNKNWKRDLLQEERNRLLKVNLVSNTFVLLPVIGDKRDATGHTQSLDIFLVHDFLRKVAFFEAKRRRSQAE